MQVFIPSVLTALNGFFLSSLCGFLKLALSPDQRGRLPQRCNPVDLQHHIQTELLRRVHLGIDIGIPHHSRTINPINVCVQYLQLKVVGHRIIPSFSHLLIFTFLVLKQTTLATYHSRIHLSDSPFAFEIRETKEGRGGGGGEKEGGGGHGKYAFK